MPGHRFLKLLLALVCQGAVAECECLWGGSFSDVQADTDLVVSGTVVSIAGNSIDLHVDRLLRGEAAGDTLRIWLKTADYCRPTVATFPVGTQWVMALHKIHEQVVGGFNPATPSVSYGRVGDYSLSSCGGYWLSQRGDHVSGNLVAGTRWVRQPKMTPVLLNIVEGYVRGELDLDTLLQASEEDPKLRELMLNTRTFIRNEN